VAITGFGPGTDRRKRMSGSRLNSGEQVRKRFSGYNGDDTLFFYRHVGTKTAVSGISYEKIVHEKDPGNRENGALVP